jgi:hypothetical protein
MSFKHADLQLKTHQSKINLEEKQQKAVPATEEDKVLKQESAECSAFGQNINLPSKVTTTNTRTKTQGKPQPVTAKKSKAKNENNKSKH